MPPLKIAVIAGDGVGPEVVSEAQQVLDALELDIEWNELPWGSEYLRQTGVMMPADGVDIARGHDAILLGAVGHPSVPDHVSLWGLLLALRQGLDLWANVRPVRLFEGIPTPLAGRTSEDIDMIFVRENSEGEYAGVGGRAHRGLPEEVATETAVFTRRAVERVARYAFDLAADRGGSLVSVTKSNACRYGYVLWDEVVAEVAREFPQVALERVLVDALAARMVQDPGSLDVVVASNLFGDILTDIGAALQGSMGMAASANIAPKSDRPGLFEPVHGSAPLIAGRGIANPLACIWSAAMMLSHLGESEGADRILDAIATVARDGPHPADLGGDASTDAVGAAVRSAVIDPVRN
jgi:tartrate dehydrogenase/decarboxylase/D-malate dehydrogenase